jgi:hypothetical protein
LLCVSFFFPAPFCLGFFVLQTFFVCNLLELQSLGFQPHTVERCSCSTSQSEKEEEEELAARPHSGRRTAAPCLDPSGKQEHRRSRGDATITRLSSTAPRGGKNKQTNKQTTKEGSKQVRKASKKDGKKKNWTKDHR